jgi:predicted MFS family arabinose efflux permease
MKGERLMFTGLTVATVIGVPLGTFIGQQTSWRVPFLVVAALASAAAIGIRVLERTRSSSAVAGRPTRVDRPNARLRPGDYGRRFRLSVVLHLPRRIPGG